VISPEYIVRARDAPSQIIRYVRPDSRNYGAASKWFFNVWRMWFRDSSGLSVLRKNPTHRILDALQFQVLPFLTGNPF